MSMEKLKELISKCKSSVYLTVNNHKTDYCSVEDYFKNYINGEYLEDIEDEVFNKMVETDTIIDLHFYPHSSVGFTKVFHYDLELALDEALESLKEE